MKDTSIINKHKKSGILPDINNKKGPNTKRVVEKLSNIRKSFDDKGPPSQRPDVSHDKGENDTMNTIISNYLALESKTDNGAENKINNFDTRN